MRCKSQFTIPITILCISSRMMLKYLILLKIQLRQSKQDNKKASQGGFLKMTHLMFGAVGN